MRVWQLRLSLIDIDSVARALAKASLHWHIQRHNFVVQATLSVAKWPSQSQNIPLDHIRCRC